MSRKQLGIIAVVLLVLLTAVYFALPKKTKTTADLYTSGPATNPEIKEQDKKAAAGLQQIVTIIANTYSRNGGGYPEGTKKGWQSIVDTVPLTTDFIDPHTKTLYAFTTKDPNFGQIQYKPNATCKDNKFAKASYRSIAVRGRLTTGIVCYSIDSQKNLTL